MVAFVFGIPITIYSFFFRDGDGQEKAHPANSGLTLVSEPRDHSWWGWGPYEILMIKRSPGCMQCMSYHSGSPITIYSDVKILVLLSNFVFKITFLQFSSKINAQV